MLRSTKGWQTEMRNRENTPDIRPLTDLELNDVTGGISIAAVLVTGIIAGWDLAPGVTIKDAATALGVDYLL